MSYSNDFDYHIRFGQEMPARVFSHLEEAKAYVVSGLEVGRQHMAAARGVESVRSNKVSVELADEVLAKIVDCQSHLEELDKKIATKSLNVPVKRVLVSRFRAACMGFTSAYNRSWLIQHDLDATVARLRWRRRLTFCAIFLIIVALPTVAGVLGGSYKGWRFLAGCLPYCFETAWRASEDRHKLELSKLEKQYESLALIGKTAMLLVKAAMNHVIPYIDPNSTAVTTSAAAGATSSV